MLNFALIGKGTFGQNYFRILRKTSGVCLKFVVTKSSESLKAALNDQIINCVVIAAPAATHFYIAKAALIAKKHVLVEKPMVLHGSECKKLQKLVKKNKKVFMVGHQYVYNEHIRSLKKKVKNKKLGELTEFRWEHFKSPIRNDVNSFWDAGPHPLSVFQYFFNPRRIVKKSLRRFGKDGISAIIQFDRGPLLTIHTAWSAPKKIRKLTIVGKKKTMVFDETLKKNRLTGPREPLRRELRHFIQCINKQAVPLTDIDFGSTITKWLEEISPIR